MFALGRLHPCGHCCCQRILGFINKRSSSFFQQGKNSNTKKNIVSRDFHISGSNHKFFPFPDPRQAERLLNYFPEPVKVIEDLLQPLVSVSPTSQPCLTFKPRLKATKWKAILHFKDPVPFTVIGCANCYEEAKTNAYLLACKMFLDLGLISKSQSKIVSAKEVLQSSISNLCRKNFCFDKNFYISFDELNVNSERKWHLTLEIFWPMRITVSSTCDTRSAAEYKCYLLAIIKLKNLKCLNFKSREIRSNSCIQLPTALSNNNFNYHIYVDASNIGFGAYFFCPNSSDVNWFYDNWPDFLDQEIKEKQLQDSTFMELYAVVAALYTWKHKFCHQSVLCYSDNLSVVSMVNNGLKLIKQPVRYLKLFNILLDVSETYHISLTAKHIHREYNLAADFLSKNKVEKFRNIVPNTREQSKKTKKLLFCLPLK